MAAPPDKPAIAAGANPKAFARATELFNEGNFVDARQEIVQEGGLEDTDGNFAAFMCGVYCAPDMPEIDITAVGEYFGKSDPGVLDVLTHFIECVIGKSPILQKPHVTVSSYLREILKHLRLPGEAQKIDRIIERAATVYSEHYPVDGIPPDTWYILMFSVVMLNTSLYSSAIRGDRMTEMEFIRQCAGVEGLDSDEGQQILSDLYRDVSANPVIVSDGGGDAQPARRGRVGCCVM